MSPGRHRHCRTQGRRTHVPREEVNDSTHHILPSVPGLSRHDPGRVVHPIRDTRQEKPRTVYLPCHKHLNIEGGLVTESLSSLPCPQKEKPMSV